MNEIRFGAYLARLLHEREYSGSRLASMIGVDPALVYRWLRNEAVPKLDAPYREEIARQLFLSEAEARQLKEAQIYSLSQPAERRPRARSGNGAVESLIRHARPRQTHAANGSGPLPPLADVPLKPGGVLWGRPAILETVIQALEALPALPRHQTNTILLSFQGPEDAYDDFPALQAHYEQAMLGVLQRGWRVCHLLRLDHDVHRSVLLVEQMLKLLGTGRYLPSYLGHYGTLAPPYDLLVIPQTTGLLFFATQNPRRADAALLTHEPEQIELLRTHFYQLLAQSQPLVRSYLGESDAVINGLYADAESQPGGRVAVKYGLSALTKPPEWYRPDSSWVQQAQANGKDLTRLIEQQQRRIAAFHTQAQHYPYRDICPKSAIELALRPGAKDQWLGFALPVEERIKQLRRVIHLLTTYDRYELALVDAAEEERIPTETCWEVAGGEQVLMVSWSIDLTGKDVIIDLMTTEPTIVHAFQEYFEELWERIPPANRDRRAVLRWLEEQISLVSRAAGE